MNRLVCAIAVAALAAGEGKAQERKTSQLEFGLDQASLLSHQSSNSAFRSAFTFRWGYLSSNRRLMGETRIGLTDLRTVGGVNFLWHFARAGADPRFSTYVTLGATVGSGKMVGTDKTDTAGGFNVGVGRRFRWGENAIRPELTVAHIPAVGTIADGSLVRARTQMGLRIGVSAFK